MGKRLIQQRRGKGSPTYRSPSHRYIGKISHKEGKGKVLDIINAPGRRSPLAVVDFGDRKSHIIANEGLKTGDIVEIKELGEVEEGQKIYNIELSPGDGGKLCRCSGTFATVISSGERKTTILLPSKKRKKIPSKCKVTIGRVSGAGRKEKPIMKAGKQHHIKKSFGKLYPRTSGVAMNAVDHPFGGETHTGRQKTVSRHAPPGRKVGTISPKKTGKKKRRDKK